jgi:hypothetical protein
VRLLNNLVDQRGLAVVDVRNNRNIPNFLTHRVCSKNKKRGANISLSIQKATRWLFQ